MLCDIMTTIFTSKELKNYTLTGAGEGKETFPFDMLYAIFGKIFHLNFNQCLINYFSINF